jgi:hypothetical protein
MLLTKSCRYNRQAGRVCQFFFPLSPSIGKVQTHKVLLSSEDALFPFALFFFLTLSFPCFILLPSKGEFKLPSLLAVRGWGITLTPLKVEIYLGLQHYAYLVFPGCCKLKGNDIYIGYLLVNSAWFIY